MRQVVSRYPLFTAFCMFLLTLYSILILASYSKDEQDGAEADSTLAAPAASIRKKNPVLPERTNIFFLKAHKCGSSTLQNILLRFGMERGLSFVLPEANNYIGNPEMFRVDMISEEYSVPSGKYNIFAHHTRYDREAVSSVMYNDAAFVTIVRHPADVYESIFSYYNFERIYNVTLEDILYKPNSLKEIHKRYFNRIGFNQISWDLGFLEENSNSSTEVTQFIKKIDEEFDLVMMSDWMEASLVLLADLMNWPLEHVRFLKLNVRTANKIYEMSDSERLKLVELNKVDYMLYTHFLNKFKKRIKDYGEEKMKRDVERLLTLNTKLKFQCVKGVNHKGFANTQAYELNDPADRLCFYATRSELPFSEELRKIQCERVKVINNLDVMLENFE